MALSTLLPAQEPLTEQLSADSEETMERVPEKFLLDEDDLREAISEWLNEHHQDSYNHDYTIEFKVDKKESYPKNGPIGGMSEPVITYVVSAVAQVDG